MLFNSFEFLVFFPAVTIIYFLLPHRFRWILLLLASCTFYMFFKPIYILILFFTIVIDYTAGLLIENGQTNKQKKFYLLCSLTANIAVLGFFKYFNFFNSNITSISNVLGLHYSVPYLSILLPIGLSFHTFQGMSYTIEVYRGNQRAEHHFGIYALYVMFYPQLVAGPIERPQNILHQFYEKHHFNYEMVTDGLKLMAWGFFKKVVIADRLTLAVDEAYNNPTRYDGMPLIIATIFFSIQIYCDFSGYSDIAIGSAKVMGFKLMKNFNQPYFSKSIKEFWSRWHISLSTWFRDYLYIPLGGNRVSRWRWYYNLFIVFLVSGLWHGANTTFIIWGCMHGFFQVFGQITASLRNRLATFTGLTKLAGLYKLLQVATTFGLVTFAWIFFRAASVSDALYISTHMFSGLFKGHTTIGDTLARKSDFLLNQTVASSFLALSLILLLILLEHMQNRLSFLVRLKHYSFPVRIALYNLLIVSILLLGTFTKVKFIYFQF